MTRRTRSAADLSITAKRIKRLRDYDYEILRTRYIYSGTSSLFLSDKYADMTIRCGDETFKTHRANVCSQSSFFDKALNSSFKEGITNEVELPEDDPAAIRHMLEFMYKGNYSVVGEHNAVYETYPACLTPEEVADERKRAPGIDLTSLKLMPKTSPWPDVDDDDSGDYAPDPFEKEVAEEYVDDAEAVDDDDLLPNKEGDELGSKTGDICNETATAQSQQQDPDSLQHLLGLMAGCPDTDTQRKALAATARHRRSGFMHLHAYLVADKYELPALRLVALRRFYRAVELTWMADEEFPDLVDELYARTTEQHQELRDIVCRLVGFHLLDNNASAKKRMEPVMKKHGEFAIGVMDYYILSVKGDCAW